MSNALVPLPVVLPLFAAGIKLAIGPRLARTQRGITVGVLALIVVIAAVLVHQTDAHGPQTMRPGGWPVPIAVVLVVDRLSALILLISSVITLAVVVYAIGQGSADKDEATPLAVFHPAYLALVAGVSDAFVAGDLFNLYVGFEILLTASYVLITLGGTGARVRAGMTYIVVSLVSSMIFLIAVGLCYAATGTLTMAQLAGRLDALPDGVRLILQLTLLVAFGIKAAVFPLSAWLPDSYPTTPAPVTAVFAGLLTKVGVYAMIRIQTLLFPGDRLGTLLLVAAALTMLIGVLGAVAQTDIKRMLSFTLVSHIGYMVFGVGLATVAGLAGAIFYVAHHITVQTTLFLVTGLIERRGGSTSLTRLGGLARVAPALAVLFFVPAMNLAGIPPLSGFLGKLGLIQAGIAAGTAGAYAMVGVALLTSLLTLYAICWVWNRAFWGERRQVPEPGQVIEGRRGIGGTAITAAVPPPAMTGPAWALVAFATAFTVAAGPMVDYTRRAAAELLARAPYIAAVLPS
ncbi:multicomponent Na+:H+ antiporter subunit D [Thermocatellispora tengchongensis]|uniref:Multicomponent Na+:H+ antiporter subunit D n=1 Tax=Thermocatellispora tengchongensis TaxID=1073253 RepID=A0A840NXD0_9ACTN|nr:Na+/H+ antiporter subunit D [Thermocatellispora tengchongensis]MBB5130353.1 multicomponent Na+:H+ antiporter subunit D [Thermocatellispora tengchongensis]